MARPTKPVLVAAGLVLVTGAGLLALLSNTSETMSETPPTPRADELPAIRVAVGAGLRHVQEASGYAFDLSGRDDASNLVVEDPVVVEYGDGPDDPLGFRLPPTRFVWIAQRAGVVHSVTTTPQLQYADFDGAYRLAQEVAATVSSAAWRRAGGEPTTEAGLRAFFADPETRETARRELGRWRAGGAELALTVKRSLAAGSNRAQAAGADGDRYLVEVTVDDVALDTELAEKVVARRRAAGDEGTPLPLSVWLDEQD